MVLRLFGGNANRRAVDRLRGEIVALVRQPPLYADYAVADTFDGRFELLALFSSLAVMRLTELEAPGKDIAQELTDGLFAGLDDDLREMGVGDLAVPKRIKKLASALLGRRNAYAEAMAEAGDGRLAEALARNVYAEAIAAADPRARRLARYARATAAAMGSAPIEAFLRGPLRLPDAGAVSIDL